MLFWDHFIPWLLESWHHEPFIFESRITSTMFSWCKAGTGRLLYFCCLPNVIVMCNARETVAQIYIQAVLFLTIAIFWQSIDVPFLLAFTSNTAIASSTTFSKLLLSTLSNSTAQNALVIVQILRVHCPRCSCSNSVACSEVRGIVSAKVDCFLFLSWNSQKFTISVSGPKHHWRNHLHRWLRFWFFTPP